MWDVVHELQRRVEELSTRLAMLQSRLAQAEQSTAKVWQSGDTAVASYWCLTPGTGGPATGTWGSITPDSFTADVYSTVGGAQTPVATGATVYWWYNDTFAADKPMPLVSNGDGTYDAIAEGCTAY